MRVEFYRDDEARVTGWDAVRGKRATFRRTGRKRTKPGRAIIADHRPELADSERLAAMHLAHWQAGASTPITAALSRADEQRSAA